jgi:DNA gyrase/topoisomerase IV subunit A
LTFSHLEFGFLLYLSFPTQWRKAMFTPDKIEEWIKEVQERPGSAVLIIQFITNRLRDLSDWNEKLRAENLELRTGARVEEYERQIVHLEYQLEMLRRQFDGQLPDISLSTEVGQPVESLTLLIYDPQGRVLRIEIDTTDLQDGETLANLGRIFSSGDSPRLLVVPAREELMFIFASGRIAALPVSALPHPKGSDGKSNWEQATIPHEPKAGDSLACLVPISKMALADYFVQISRRGFMKKIRKALAPSMMDNQYIGAGVKLTADQTLDLCLCKDGARFVLISWEGYLQCVSEQMLPYAIVEAMRLGSSDHLVAVFAPGEGNSILVMTQIGKIIHRMEDSLETATDLQRKGQMLYSKARRDQGVRVVGAAAVDEADWGIALHIDGNITLHAIEALLGSGSIPTESELLAFTTFSSR